MFPRFRGVVVSTRPRASHPMSGILPEADLGRMPVLQNLNTKTVTIIRAEGL